MNHRLIENVRMYASYIVDQIVEYREADDLGLIIKLNDGDTVFYDDMDKTVRTLPRDIDGMTEEVYRKEFGIRLRRLLRIRGMSQSDLADAIGITNAGLSGYINGKHTPSFYMVNKIARVLKCSVDELRYIG